VTILCSYYLLSSLTVGYSLDSNACIEVWSSITKVVLYSTIKKVIASVAIDDVTTPKTGHGLIIIVLTLVLTRITIDSIITSAAVNDIIVLLAQDTVITFTTIDTVITF
jgi:hypothetical protein